MSFARIHSVLQGAGLYPQANDLVTFRYFATSRRKFGLFTLLFACIALGVGIRHRDRYDSFKTSIAGWNVRAVLIHGMLGVSIHETQIWTPRFRTQFASSSTDTQTWWLNFNGFENESSFRPRTTTEWQIEFIRFRIGRLVFPGFPTGMRLFYFQVPLLSLSAMLAVLSAYLLLSKPKLKKLRTETAPIAEV